MLRYTILLTLSILVLSCNSAKIKAPQIESLDDYEILISSRNTGTVKRYRAKTGEYLGEFGGKQIISETQEVALGPDGMLYVTSLPNKHIIKFDPQTGQFLGAFSSGYALSRPTKMTFGPDGFIYVSQWGSGQSSVVRFDAKTGKFDKAISNNLPNPLGHAWDKDGNLYVACFNSKDIRKFDPKGKSLGVVSPSGVLLGPSNPWFDKQGDLLVSDWEDGQIKRFKLEKGKLVFDGVFARGFTKLEGLVYGPDGYLYGCDWMNNNIRKLNASTGADLGVFLQIGDMKRPNSILFWKRE